MSRQLALVAAVAAVLLVSCASLQAPDQGNRTLLVVSVPARRTSYSGFPLAYELGLAGSARTVPLNVGSGLTICAELPPGTYTIDRIYALAGPQISGGLYTGPVEPDSIGPWRFTLETGEITILPVALAVTVEPFGSDSHVQRVVPEPVDRGQVLARLDRIPGFDRWRVAAEEPVDPGALQAPPARRVDNRFRWWE